MPKPPPLPLWPNQPAYIVGGGKSLEHFDFEQLRGRNVIGCNHAFLAHPDIIDITVFGDHPFWKRHALDLAAWPGYVASNAIELEQYGPVPKWLALYSRIDEGWGDGSPFLAFNYNTGALAINLAAVLGASPIYLLGYDMHPCGHWHGRNDEAPQQDSHYRRFIEGFAALEAARKLLPKPPEVFNVSEGSTHLQTFPIVPFASASLVAPAQLNEVPHASG